MVEPKETSTDDVERYRLLARQAQRAIAELGPHVIVDLTNKLDSAIEERDRAKSLLANIAMASRNLLNAAKTRGIGGPDTEADDGKLFLEMETALAAVDTVNRYLKNGEK